MSSDIMSSVVLSWHLLMTDHQVYIWNHIAKGYPHNHKSFDIQELDRNVPNFPLEKDGKVLPFWKHLSQAQHVPFLLQYDMAHLCMDKEHLRTRKYGLRYARNGLLSGCQEEPIFIPSQILNMHSCQVFCQKPWQNRHVYLLDTLENVFLNPHFCGKSLVHTIPMFVDQLPTFSSKKLVKKTTYFLNLNDFWSMFNLHVLVKNN